MDARELVNTLPVADLERLIREFGEEPRARRIALAIDAQRQKGTHRLDPACWRRPWPGPRAVPGAGPGVPRTPRDPTPATRTFQAVRIAVNRELDNLERFLETAYELLRAGGRSGDHIVSLAGRQGGEARVPQMGPGLCLPAAHACLRLRLGPERPPPLPADRGSRPARRCGSTPRARSARLRAVERIAAC